MKKFLAVTLLLSVILAGCGSSENDTSTAEASTNDIVTEPNSEVVTEMTPDPTEEQMQAAQPMITVSVPVTTNDTVADDGNVIFRLVSQNMTLIMQDPDVANSIFTDFSNRIDLALSAQNATLEKAQNNYTPSDHWVPYLCSMTYAPQRVDQVVLSFSGSYVHHDGGAHAVIAPSAANYNVMTGEVLTLGSIIVNAESVKKLCDLTIEKLASVAEEKFIREGFEEAVKQRFSVEESYDENWYFTTTGLCFYFDPYAIAPYSSGIVTAEIPYAELTGIIDDAFFPPEQEDCSGTVQAEPAENVDMTQFTRISELVVDAEKPKYVIHCDDTIQNLRITLNDAELGYYTIFAAQALCSSDAVVIQAEPGLFHHLNIVYDSNGTTVTVPLLSE